MPCAGRGQALAWPVAAAAQGPPRSPGDPPARRAVAAGDAGAAWRPEGRPRLLRGARPGISGGAAATAGTLSGGGLVSRNSARASAGVFQPSVLRAGRSARQRPRPAAPGLYRPGRCPWGNTGAAARWCSRCCPAARASAGRRSNLQSAATANRAWDRISQPWSQVSDRRSASGRPAITGVSASRYGRRVMPAGSGTSRVNRVVRSTSVPIATCRPRQPAGRLPSARAPPDPPPRRAAR